MEPLRFVFGMHNHQPVGNFDYVFADHVRDVYKPFLERIAAHGFLPVALHISGPLLEWLERYIFPIERAFDGAAAERLAPAAFRAFAAAGTTTAMLYGALWEPSTDAAFRAAETHGIRAIIGKVMMDRVTYGANLPAERILELRLRQSGDLVLEAVHALIKVEVEAFGNAQLVAARP